jgi:hypothetical protein
MAKKKPPTKAESAHMARVAELPCCVCGDWPVHIHHITQCGRRLGHKFTLPLCPECHMGRRGFSGLDRSAWDKSLSNQLKLLKIVKQQLGK